MFLPNALTRYYAEVCTALNELQGAPGGAADDFSPGPALPPLTDAVSGYLDASAIAFRPLPEYQGRRMTLLDLTLNPATMTTKTFASLVIVARAVRHIQDTGERLCIITPSSANKAIAMRDAVLRAIRSGLARPDQLSVACIVPAGAAYKLRASQLAADPDLASRNPVAVYHGADPAAVKVIAQQAAAAYRAELESAAKTRLWYTLRLENYLAADVVRAFAEADLLPPGDSGPRLHVHAVSSAFGLLGHAHGRAMLAGRGPAGLPSRYFLVQHLGAPDMVVSLYDGPAGPGGVPAYSRSPESGRYAQGADPRFPAFTDDPAEILDPTFYTRQPVTSPQMNEIIRRQGGGGIVVSMAECRERYGQVRAMLAAAGCGLPADPAAVREWSLVMAMTGLLNAVDRGAVTEHDIVVHGSGCYAAADYDELPASSLRKVRDAADLGGLLLAAAGQ